MGGCISPGRRDTEWGEGVCRGQLAAEGGPDESLWFDVFSVPGNIHLAAKEITYVFYLFKSIF